MGQKPKELEIPVDEYTTPCLAFAKKSTPIDEIQVEMEAHGIRHIPVLDDNKPIGIISDRDVRAVNNLEVDQQFLAEDFMTPDPYLVPKGTMMTDVIYDMSTNKIGSAIVINDDGTINGIFTTTDALNALLEILRGEEIG